jgi:hypothetical protein
MNDRPESSMQKRIREATESVLEDFGHRRYKEGRGTRRPPMDSDELAQQELIERAELLMVEGAPSQEEAKAELAKVEAEIAQQRNVEIERLQVAYDAGMIGKKTLLASAGLEGVDGPEEETEQVAAEEAPKAP